MSSLIATKNDSLHTQNENLLLCIKQVCIAYDNTSVLRDISLDIKAGEIGCILGPSGSGKTSLLRAIAGFISIQSGSITINNTEVSSAENTTDVSLRSVGVVFQDYALFPHLTVAQNIEFGLAALDSNERETRTAHYMNIMGISELSAKYPADLSGGQQQRVAIARAIAPQPTLLLMDEAFSSLDPQLREQVAFDLRAIIKELGLTVILVTHDQSEAFAFADKIAVIANGALQQYSSAYSLYHKPQTEFVANFIGDGAFIKGEIAVNDKGAIVATALGELLLPQNLDESDFSKGDKLNILLRPDDVIHDDASPTKAIIKAKQFKGAFIRYELKVEATNEKILCFAPSHHNHDIGETFGIRAEVEHVIGFIA
jgi:iron(III) transport system ATP-binding protein